MRFKRLIAVLMVGLLVIQPLSASSAAGDSSSEKKDSQNKGSYSEKNEVVYATLDATGDQEAMYVVNNFTVDKPGKMVDYGSYTSIENLTNLTDIEQNDNKVTFNATGDQFYYQGNLEGQSLPWDINVSYTLNGKKLPPEKLLGKDGQLEIHIETKANEKARSTFFKNYMLQISVPLNTDIFQNIKTKNGMIASAGKNKQVTFTVMPGKEENFVVKADVNDLEMESIKINAMPPSMSIDKPNAGNMKNDMKSLSDATAQINKAVGKLNEGIAELNDGAVRLQEGSASYKKGINKLADQSSKLIAGSKEIGEALENISQSLGSSSNGMNIGKFKELQNGLTAIANGLKKTEEGLSSLKANYAKAFTTLDQSIGAVPAYDISKKEIQKLKKSNADPEVVNKLIETYQKAQTAKGTYSKVKKAFKAVNPTLEGVISSLQKIQTNIQTMADKLGQSLNNTKLDESMKKLQQGLSKLSSNYNTFHSGLSDYTNGVAELSSSYSKLHSGVTELTNGTNELENGVNELHKGTGELAESTDDLPDQMQSEIDQMMNKYDKSDFDPVSYVSSKNNKVKNVQFVIKTESIKKEEDKQEDQPKEEAEKGFWDRLLNLFR
ncbi:YhgE/Pip domain-containing protein [Virgibacillus ihumii]|uniref:YhgE/Pip domain-containing protein n=1 Tax=Virgibacillus ihumii TaxID=2686091 RepID=UPI00157C94F4|nr:YhgE/Pip domain-containing protein [Virgibacillus ihumii]